MDQDATWYGGRPRPRRHCVRWGPSSPPKKGGGTLPRPHFLAHVHCGQTAGWIKMALGRRVGLSPRHIVLDGDSAPLTKKGAKPFQFSAHFYCGETAGCINMPLGMEVGLSPGDFVLDGDPVPLSKKGWSPQIFGPRILWPNGCMDQDAAWHAGRRRPTRHSVGWGPSSFPLKGHIPQFSAIVRCGQTAG